jgi:TPR repeat protein
MEGSAEAMVQVGHMLMSGYGIRQDPSEAARWLRQAW